MSARRRVVHDPAEFGRVAVMLGGTSSEREVSLQSGAAVLEALKAKGVNAVAWDPKHRGLSEFASATFDRVWNALHGPWGEDGILQGALTALNVPYTGSGVLGSALAMDKLRSKQIFSAAGIPTPEFAVISSASEAEVAAERLGYPCVMKPVGQGSSVGMSIVGDGERLRDAVDLALSFGESALVERYVRGAEVTVAVLQGEALPSVRIETPREFYDYHAKYEADSTRYVSPASDDADTERLYADLAQKAFDALACDGWGRVDFMHEPGSVPQVLEVNTVPGMTSHSLVPIAADAAGIDFAELCWRILETSMDVASLEFVEAAANDA